jgi:hypothetical protein
MDATLYTGNGTGQSIVNAAPFKPDFVWVKNRTQATSHYVYDVIRGTGNRLITNGTLSEASISGVTAFNSNGFTVGTETGNNNTGDSYVGWQWQAGQGTTSSNTNGSITSTVSVNASAGFSVVTYTGNGTVGATFGHGLGIAPQMILFKNRTNAVAWGVYHISTGNTGYLGLNSTAAVSTETTTFLNSTTPSSSLITLGNGNVVNQSTINYVAYCWTPIAGFSAFGSYTGNGSSDGPFVYLGFRPKFVMWKRTDSTGDWIIFDSSRQTYNYEDAQLVANSSSAEAVTGGGFVRMDFLSNGFKVRSTDSYINASGGTYIYMAFAENPFKYALAR